MPEALLRFPDVQMVDPAEVEPADDADPATRPDIDFLMQSLDEEGQKVPVVIFPNREAATTFKFKLVDGNGRHYCLLRLGRKMSAIVLERVPRELELIELGCTHNALRRKMSLSGLAVKAERHLELTGGTQKETAARLRCSDTTISRALALTRRIPPELRTEACRQGHFFVSLISPLPTGEAMKQAIAFASTPRPDGKKPARDQVEKFVRQLKSNGKPKSRKPKAVPLRMNGRMVTVTIGDKDSASTVAEDLKSIVARLGKHADVAPEGWPFLFQ